MIVKAKHWINVDGDWHCAGETFEVKNITGFEESVEVVADNEPVVEPEKPRTKRQIKQDPIQGQEKPEEESEKPVEPTVKRRGRMKA